MDALMECIEDALGLSNPNSESVKKFKLSC